MTKILYLKFGQSSKHEIPPLVGITVILKKVRMQLDLRWNEQYWH